jgi:hypothetical protein
MNNNEETKYKNELMNLYKQLGIKELQKTQNKYTDDNFNKIISKLDKEKVIELNKGIEKIFNKKVSLTNAYHFDPYPWINTPFWRSSKGCKLKILLTLPFVPFFFLVGQKLRLYN